MTTGSNKQFVIFDLALTKGAFTTQVHPPNPVLEQHIIGMGGVFEDFHVYRFPLYAEEFVRIYTDLNSRATLKSKSAEVGEYIRDMVQQHRTISGLKGAGADADIAPILSETYPETASALRPYQRAGVKFLATLPYTLLADDPGSGKTLQTIAAIISANIQGDILVLSPSIATQVTWPAELKKWAPGDEVIAAVGTRTQREKALQALQTPAKGRRWVLCNIEMAKVKYYKSQYEYQYWQLFFTKDDTRAPAKQWATIIVDESHRALITVKTRPHQQSQTRCGMGKLKVAPGGKRIAISGTPFRGKLQNLWGTLNWLDSERYPTYWPWATTWFNTELNTWTGYQQITTLKPELRQHFYAEMAPFTLRRTKHEIAPELPPKTYVGSLPPGYEPQYQIEEQALVGHWLPMSRKQAKSYMEMKRLAYTRLDEGDLSATGALAELTRLKQFAGAYGAVKTGADGEDQFYPTMPSNKFDWLLEFLEDRGIPWSTGNKVVVASQFTSIINLFEQELKKKKIPVLKITGEVSAKDRETAQAQFQSEEGPQVMLLNTIAGGVSLTLDRADDLVILDETFTPDDQTQVEDRIHRVSRVHNVNIHYVRSLGTVEEDIALKTFHKDTLQKDILDGQRGIDIARNLLKDTK